MAYTTIDDPSEHCQGLNYIGDLDDRQKRNYGGNADSYVPDIFLGKSFAGSSHPEHSDSVATGGFTTAYEQASYGRRGVQTMTTIETDGYTMGADGQVNAQDAEHMALTWNCGSTGTIQSFYPSGTGYGNNRTSVSASGSALAHYYTVNSTAKQSVVFYEGTGSSGAEVPHHLGVKPTFAMFRKMGEGTFDQTNYYDAAPFMFYKDMTAVGVADGSWGGHHGSGWQYAPSGGVGSTEAFSAAPDSTKFTLGTHGYTNTDDYDYICYCFSDLQGYFKTGFYEGNGDAKGPFVYTGFEPEMILINPQDNGTNPATHGNLGSNVGAGYYGGWYWFVNGMTGNGFNPHNKTWNFPDSQAMQNYDEDALDIYSNGFKIRAPGGDVSGGWQAGNQVDKTVWYAAWAKHPLVTSGGVPATAR